MTTTSAPRDASVASELPPRIVLFDGVCGLCHWLVRFLVRVDRKRALRYAPLQGETAARLRSLHPDIPDDLDTVVFVEDGDVHLRSRAVLRTLAYVGWPWRAFRLFSVLPRPVTDWAYERVARVRYRVFGKLEACEVPSVSERSLVLP